MIKWTAEEISRKVDVSMAGVLRKENPKVVQVCHGPVIPEFISAYSLRCHSLFPDLERSILSVGGLILRDFSEKEVSQYHSILLTLLAIIRGNRSFEILLSEGWLVRRRYLKEVSHKIIDSDVVVFEGPWQYRLFKGALKGKIVIYDAHNCESQLRHGNKYEDYVRRVEKELVNRCDILFSVTPMDHKALMELSGNSEEKFHLVPHVLSQKKLAWKGVESRKISFIGSMYGPNVSALKFIIELSQKLPEFEFHVIGNVRPGLTAKKQPNLFYHGVVSDEIKSEILSSSMFALNPVTEGSGRNVKMVDYLMHGVPTISTKIGTRGFEQYNIAQCVFVAELTEFYQAIKNYDGDRDELLRISAASGQLYEQIQANELFESPTEILKTYLGKRKY